MRLQQLRLILAIAESGSLRAVAEQMNVTQPALTKTLRLLEEEFGAALAVRSAKGVRLTAAGELLAARSAIVLREIDRAREEVAWQTSGLRTRVAIGVSPAAAISLLAGALGRLRQRWPTVRVRVVDAIYPRSLTMVRAGELDLAVGPLPSNGAGRDLQTRPLFEARNALVVRRGHPQSQVRHLAGTGRRHVGTHGSGERAWRPGPSRVRPGRPPSASDRDGVRVLRDAARGPSPSRRCRNRADGVLQAPRPTRGSGPAAHHGPDAAHHACTRPGAVMHR